MIQLGEFQQLIVDRDTSVGFFLRDIDNTEDVLLPNKYIEEDMKIGDTIRVFVYNDSEDRMVATTEVPHITLNKFAFLHVQEVNQVGAFLDWGLEKQLLVPFKNQPRNLEEGKRYLIYLYEDLDSDRLVGTAKVDQYLKKTAEENELEEGQKVDLLVKQITDLGATVIINQEILGIVYQSDIFDNVYVGDELTGYVKKIRDDFKVDVSLQPIGVASIEPNAQKIKNALQKNNGFLAVSDKSDPEEIKARFQMSKKLFKKAIGSLYRERIIEIKDDGIHLVK